MRAKRAAALLAGCALTVLAAILATYGRTSFYDLNLHYFAGLIERQGTYTDFEALRDAMRGQGVAMPSEGVYGTPTLVALVFQPLSFLSLELARIVWIMACALGLAVGVRKAIGRPDYKWLLWLVIVLFTPAAFLGLNLANISTLTTAALLYAFGATRDKEWARVGVVLGVAFALKLYPGFVLIPFLFMRQWRVLFYAAGSAAVLFICTVPALGWSDTWVAVKTTLSLGGFVHSGFDNISAPGWLLHLTDDESLARSASLIALPLAVALLWWKRMLAPQNLFALACVAMLTVQSIAWRHYTPLLVVVLVSLWATNRDLVTRLVMALAYAMGTGLVSSIIAPGSVGITFFTTTCYTFGVVALLVVAATKNTSIQETKSLQRAS